MDHSQQWNKLTVLESEKNAASILVKFTVLLSSPFWWVRWRAQAEKGWVINRWWTNMTRVFRETGSEAYADPLVHCIQICVSSAKWGRKRADSACLLEMTLHILIHPPHGLTYLPILKTCLLNEAFGWCTNISHI